MKKKRTFKEKDFSCVSKITHPWEVARRGIGLLALCATEESARRIAFVLDAKAGRR